MADKRWRTVVFDVGVALILIAAVSGPVVYIAVAINHAARKALQWAGVL